MNRRALLLSLSIVLFANLPANAAVTLVEKDDWKVTLGGFVELDLFRDNTRSFAEVVGNGPVDRPGTVAGNNGRTQFSGRNSRFAFSVLPPLQGEWKTKGYFEFDFLGYDPKPNAAEPKNSEASFYSNATLRMRHLYFNAENDGWTFLAGQTWSLFGWQPNYVVVTASVPPAPGVLYQRTSQVMGMKTLAIGEQNKLQVAVSVERPTQKDSDMPNVNAGVRWAYQGWRSGFSSPTGEVGVEPLSVGLSATTRTFETPHSASATDGRDTYQASAYAVNALLPLLPAAEKDARNTLTLLGEYSNGKGYGDEFTGFNGGLSQLSAGVGSGVAGSTNLDAGLGGFDSSGKFKLVQLSTWNLQLQYHLPFEAHTFVTLGHSQLSSNNIATVTALGKGYDKVTADFVNVFHDVTAQVRVAGEYAKFVTHYTDAVKGKNDRYLLSAYFRF